MEEKIPLVVGLLVAVGLSVATTAAADTKQQSRASFLTTEDLSVVRTVTLDGRDAAELRELIDEEFGDADDEVEDWEVDEYETSFPDRRLGERATGHVLNGHPGTIVGASVSASGATGEASFETRDDEDDGSSSFQDDQIDEDDESGDPLELRIRERVAFEPRRVGFEDTLSYYFTNTTDQSQLTFQAPPGFTITRTTGLGSVEFQGDQRRIVTGEMSEGDPINVRFRLASETSSFLEIEDFLGANAKFPSTSTTLSFQETLRSASFTSSYELSGFDAIGLKGLIDQLGNADGVVQSEEVARVVNDVEDNLAGTASEVYFVDGDPARITSLTVSVDGLTGDVNTQTRVTVEQTGTLAFNVRLDENRVADREAGLSADERREAREEDDRFVEPFVITIGKTAPNSDVSVSLPDGYEFRVDPTEGLEGAVFSSSFSEVEGAETSQGSVVLFAVRLDSDVDEVAFGLEEDTIAAAGFGTAGVLGLGALAAIGFGYAGTSRMGTLIDRFGGDGDPPAAGSAAESGSSSPSDGGGRDRVRAEQQAAEGPSAHPEAGEPDPDEGPTVTFPRRGSEGT